MKELSESQLVNVNRLDFLKSQFLFFIGVTFVIVFGFYALLFYRSFEKFRFFFLGYVITISLFLFFKAKDYYAIGIYPIYIGFGSVYLENILKTDGQGFLSQSVFYSLCFCLYLYIISLFLIKVPNLW